MQKFIVFLTFVGLLLSHSAFASAWEKTFTGPGMASYVTEESAVMVVALEQTKQAKAARKALIEALRASGSKLVMDQKSLGDVSQLGDTDIVQRCAKLPINTIAIMRLFPGSDSASTTAVVTFYDKSGESLNALSAQPGVEVAAAAQADAGLGVNAKAAQTVMGITGTQKKSAREARDQYEKEAIWFEDIIAVNQHGQQVGSWSNAYQGKYKEPLEPKEFYEKVGREDLAQEYQDNMDRRAIFQIPGGITALVGLTAVCFCWVPIVMKDQIGEENVTPGIIGLGAGGGVLSLVGLGFGMIGGFFPGIPTTDSEARELADQHNKTLRQQLGLEEE